KFIMAHKGGEFAKALGDAFDNAGNFGKDAFDKAFKEFQKKMQEIEDKLKHVGTGVKQHSKDVDQALNDVVGRINNYLQAIGSGMTLTKEAYQAMSESARTHLRAMADEWAQTTQKQSVNFFQLLTALDSVGKGISETFVNGKLVVKENVDQIVAETTKLN